MSTIHRLPERVMVFTTPEELRKLADKMEQHVKNVKIGERRNVIARYCFLRSSGFKSRPGY